MYYEELKHRGLLEIVGVNTFLNSKGSPTVLPQEVIRATEEEKQLQIETVERLQKASKADSEKLLKALSDAAARNENIFEQLMETCKKCSLGQITQSLFEVGGQYRRNM